MNSTTNVRRKNGEGSLYRLPDGRYGAAVHLGKDDSGKRNRIVVTAKTEAEVVAKMQHLLKSRGLLPENKIVVNSQSLISDMVHEFMQNGLNSNTPKSISSRTYENYEYAIAHFLKHFNGKTVGRVGTQELNQFWRYMSESKENGQYKFSQTTIHRVESLVKRMYARAYRKGLIELNPCDDEAYSCPPSKKVMPEIKSLSAEELKAVLMVIEENDLVRPVINLMLHTGMRSQEVLGLRWKNIDLETGCVSVTEAITIDIQYDANGKKIGRQTVLAGTKRGTSDRRINIGQDIIDILCQWKIDAPRISKTQLGDNNYVFGNSRSDHWTYGGFRASLNHMLIDNKTISSLGLHRIRHTVATIMAETGVESLKLMRLMGHTQMKTTLRYIDKYSDKIQSDNCEMLQTALKKRLQY